MQIKVRETRGRSISSGKWKKVGGEMKKSKRNTIRHAGKLAAFSNMVLDGEK